MKEIVLALIAAVSMAVSMPQESGTIAGRILHADGTPAIGVRVVAVEVGTPEAAEPLLIKFLSKISRSDSAGRFRFDNVAPGSYYVAAGADYYAQGGGGGFMIYPPTYFPGTAGTPATAIAARSGVTSELEFRLASPPTPSSSSFKVSGRVLGDLTRFRRNAEGYFFVRFRGTFASRTLAGIAPDGAFELRGIAPGSYTVSLGFMASDAGLILLQAIVDVADKDITDLTFDTDGRSVTVRGRPAPPPAPRPIR